MQKTIRGSVLSEGLCMGTVRKSGSIPETDIHKKIPPEDIENECNLFPRVQAEFTEGDILIIDGSDVIINPDDRTVKEFEKKREQAYAIYSAGLKAMNGKPVTIHTFDIAGGKKYPCIPIPEEENPLLGRRGIRYCTDNTDLFFPQLRALLRTAIHGYLYVMFPMITEEEEVKTLLSLVERMKKDLDKEKITYGQNVKIGIMIETPADRNNAKIARLYREDHPAVLPQIKAAIDTAEKYNKHVCLCGEMAGNALFTQALLDCGLECFSMPPERIQKIKKRYHVGCGNVGRETLKKEV